MTSTKPTMAEVAKVANVGIATVDRVLNGRARVKPETEQKVMDAARQVGFNLKKSLSAEPSAAPGTVARRLAFVLQQRNPIFYQQVRAAIESAALRLSIPCPSILFSDGVDPAEVSATLRSLRGNVDAIGVVAADDPLISDAIQELADEGVEIYTVMTDLSAERRNGYIGMDNRKVGRTAAWAIHNLSQKPGKVGVLMGHHRLLCQEDCEIGFRSYFRERQPEFKVLDPLFSLEDPELARQATLDLLDEHPDLVGLYLNSGALEGVLEALRETGRHKEIICVGHELVPTTRAALTEGIIQFVIAHPLERIASMAMEVMSSASQVSPQGAQTQWILPLDIFTSENI